MNLCYLNVQEGGIRVSRRAVRCFFAVESVLYALFLALDVLSALDTMWLKFTGIALVAVVGLFAGRGLENRFTTAALCLTVTADVFLLLLDSHYMLGVALFLAVQTLYTLRLAVCRGDALWRQLLVRLIPALAAAAWTAPYGVTTALPAAYIVWFAVNLLDSLLLAARQPDRRRVCFAVGLILFFCCDLCVGAHNLPASALPAWLPGFAQIAMWAFYLPGQVLILASTDAMGGRQA